MAESGLHASPTPAASLALTGLPCTDMASRWYCRHPVAKHQQPFRPGMCCSTCLLPPQRHSVARRIVRRLAGGASANSRRDHSRNDRLSHSTPARIGSPALHSCNRWRRFGSLPGSAVRLLAMSVHPFFRMRPAAASSSALPPPDRGSLDEWFSDRTPRPAPCPRPRHAPA
jgi:hypothetical protein